MTVLALYTTVYPGVERFLAVWYHSVQSQTDQGFHLWIGVDELDIETVERALGARPQATWVRARAGDSHAQVRQRALTRIAQNYDGVVLVDSDDVLHPSRVAAARAALRGGDVAGCALRVVDERGRDLDLVMRLPPGTAPADVLPRHNIYGLSNTSYTCKALRRCLPIPDEAVLIDWYLVTRAWLSGMPLAFDAEVRMDYRQHGANTARVRPPFTASQVRTDTELVRRHFAIVRNSPPPESLPHRLEVLADTAADVEQFHWTVVLHQERLEAYARALKDVTSSPLWWSSVAHPSLRHLWSRSEEQQ